ncbi:MAG: hypothetical protein JWP25_8289 [Bradyrhizobium sp.]|jgi:hypothetical protein|nr:hypothetical protein [Bradyrhizobium sp.]MEA2869275.1 hypothetical protein [Bradyrhizobium sp.]
MPTSLNIKNKKSPSIYWPGIAVILVVQAIVFLSVSGVVLKHPNVAASTNAIQTEKAD